MNPSEESGSNTLILRYDGIYKIYTSSGLIDSNALTTKMKSTLRNGGDFYIDSITINADSFTLYLNDPLEVNPDSIIERSVYLRGNVTTTEDSVYLHTLGFKLITGITEKEASGVMFTWPFAGDKTQLYNEMCQRTIKFGPFGSSIGTDGACNYLDLDSLQTSLGDNDTLTYWDYKRIYD